MNAGGLECLFCRAAVRHRFSARRAGSLRIGECTRCGLWVLENAPRAEERRRIYGEGYFDSWGVADEEFFRTVHHLKQQTFERILRRTARFRPPARGPAKLLDVGCAFGASLEAARRLGWEAEGLEVNPVAVSKAVKELGLPVRLGDFAEFPLAEGVYDAVLMVDTLEHLPDPVRALDRSRRLLRRDGLLVLNVPAADSFSARALGPLWPQLKREHLFYPTRRSLALLLEEAGFTELSAEPMVKVLNLRYLRRVMDRYPVPVLSFCVRALERAVSESWRRRAFSVRSGEMLVIARRREGPSA